MKESMYWRMLLFVCLVALTACTAATSSTPGEGNSASLPKHTAVPALNPVTPTPEAALATANPAATKSARPTIDAAAGDQAGALPEDAVLVFERAGGLKGIGPSKMTWTFYADGRVMSSDGRSWQVAPAEVAALVDDLGALGFDTLQASYQPADTCCDLVTYTFRLQLEGVVYETAVMEGANAPQKLLQAVDLVNQFLLDLPT